LQRKDIVIARHNGDGAKLQTLRKTASCRSRDGSAKLDLMAEKGSSAACDCAGAPGQDPSGGVAHFHLHRLGASAGPVC
jgi:hypothetical protein